MAQQDGSEAVERRPAAGRVAAGAGIALGVTLVTGGTAQAQDFTVTNLDGGSSPGSLRDAIVQANTNPGADRVVFQTGLSGTIHLNPPSTSYGDLNIYEALDIVGPGADQIAVSGDARSRIFDIYPRTYGDDVSISGLKVIQGNQKYSEGGDIRSDYADLTLTNMVIRTGTAEQGGGVYEDEGTLTMRDSTVVGNAASDRGGGVDIRDNPSEYEAPPTPPGQTDQQTVQPSVITGSTINNNAAGTKYGFDGQRSQAPGADATQYSPQKGHGGGIYTGSALTVENSTLTGNAAGGDGGGIYAGFFTFNGRVAGSGALDVRSTTVSGNAAGSGGGIYWSTYIPQDTTGTPPPNPVIENSIVGANDADGPQNGNDLAGSTATQVPTQTARADASTSSDAVFDSAFSLFKDTTGVTVNETVPGSNITGQDPQLAALGDNGGPTQTMAPLSGSPVVDHGRTPAGETTDQRGEKRPFDLPEIGNSAAAGADGADIGAYERQGAAVTGSCEGRPATLSGTENRDILTGTPGDDVIVGFGGNDTIKGLQGNDLVCAGDGLDQVTGGVGDDRLKGEPGNDRLWGQGGNDTLIDSQGDDLLSGGVGNDIQKGGAGEDRVFGANGNDRLFGQAASDVILGAKGNDFLRGGPGNDRLSGGVGVNDVQQ
jgi:Ca2+-binding RTX toxin-like protein